MELRVTSTMRLVCPTAMSLAHLALGLAAPIACAQSGPCKPVMTGAFKSDAMPLPPLGSYDNGVTAMALWQSPTDLRPMPYVARETAVYRVEGSSSELVLELPSRITAMAAFDVDGDGPEPPRLFITRAGKMNCGPLYPPLTPSMLVRYDGVPLGYQELEIPFTWFAQHKYEPCTHPVNPSRLVGLGSLDGGRELLALGATSNANRLLHVWKNEEWSTIDCGPIAPGTTAAQSRYAVAWGPDASGLHEDGAVVLGWDWYAHYTFPAPERVPWLVTYFGGKVGSLPTLPTGFAPYGLSSFDPDGPGPSSVMLVLSGTVDQPLLALKGTQWQSLGSAVRPAVPSLPDWISAMDSLFSDPLGGRLIAPVGATSILTFDGKTWQLPKGLEPVPFGNSHGFHSLPYDADGPGPVEPTVLLGSNFKYVGPHRGFSIAQLSRFTSFVPLASRSTTPSTR